MARGFKTGGRQRGTLNKRTQAMLEEAAKGGRLPKDILLAWAQHQDELGQRLARELAGTEPGKERNELMAQLTKCIELAIDSANKAAPYFHVRRSPFDGENAPVSATIHIEFVGANRPPDLELKANEIDKTPDARQISPYFNTQRQYHAA